jgi:hypothetical protein
MAWACARLEGKASGMDGSGERTTALIEEQKFRVAGAGRWAFRQRFARCRMPAILSFSKLERCRLKFTDQAQ